MDRYTKLVYKVFHLMDIEEYNKKYPNNKKRYWKNIQK